MVAITVLGPSIDSQIEEVARKCQSCVMYADKKEKTPLVGWDWPEHPWSRLHADFLGPTFGKMFLVVIDTTSKWVECFDVNNITAQTTIKIFRGLFARFGLPLQLCTDNGPTFNSDEFKKILLASEIKNVTAVFYHPETNGLAENAVQIVKHAILKSRYDNPWADLFLKRFLFYTPHMTAGKFPAKILLGGHLKTSLDLIFPFEAKIVEAKQDLQKKVRTVTTREGVQCW